MASTALEGWMLIVFVMATCCIAASGYVINDIYDVENDKANNRPNAVAELGIPASWRIYWTIVTLGCIASIAVALRLNELPLLWIYPCSVALLWAYSKWLKKRPLSGNLLVSLFTGLVPGILLVAERQALSAMEVTEPSKSLWIWLLLTAYLCFAFLSNMAREIIKDIEDSPGDRAMGHRTLPILLGIKTSKWIAATFVLSVLVLTIFFAVLAWKYALLPVMAVLSIALLPLLLLLLFKISRASQPSHFTIISKDLKILMIAGLLTLLYASYVLPF